MVQVADKVLFVDGMVAPIPINTKNIDQRIIPGDLSFRDNFGPYTVPQGEYFVIGDNRDDSRDKRFWGCVPEENIKGKAVFVYWSWEPHPDPPAGVFHTYTMSSSGDFTGCIISRPMFAGQDLGLPCKLWHLVFTYIFHFVRISALTAISIKNCTALRWRKSFMRR